jgi:hypothetical protein
MSSRTDEKYEVRYPVMPQFGWLGHIYLHFTLKGINFFILLPTFDYLIDYRPERCERSPSGVPYPKLEHPTQALLDTQQYTDLANLVDGMDLDEVWGGSYL